MKKTQMLALLFALLILSSALAQTPRVISAQAEKSWQPFYAAFRAAVNKRDRAALKQMMANPFETNGGGQLTPAKFLNGMTNAGWKQLQRSVGLGTKPLDNGSRRPVRVTTDGEAGCPIFEFGKDGRWRWTAVMGD